MNCKDIMVLLHAYVDNELDFATLLSVDAHLQQCPACHQEMQALSTLGAVIRCEVDSHQAPLRLQQRLAAQIAVGQRRRGWPKWPGYALQPMVALAASAFLAVSLVGYVERAAEPRPLTKEVVANHIRSLLAGHLTDVASSDRHTVKPWFSGKLDYAPPVSDLAGDGFPLAGGRLDYLDKRAVTALVYRRRQHIINVFVWPNTDGDSPVDSQQTEAGYNLVAFVHNGMNYQLISDLNSEELGLLARLLRS